MTYRILGIEDSDGDKCECCGTPCPKRRIVLDNGEQTIRLGSSCAALRLSGNKSRSSQQRVIAQASARAYAEKWIAVYGSAQNDLLRIAAAIRVRFCHADVYQGQILVGDELSFGGKP